jgi:hypothetical protein
MTSNRVVTYIDMRLNSVDEYWSGIVVPSVQGFRSTPSPGTVFNAALSVWHLHDWVWHERNPGQDSHGSAFITYRNDLLAACPELGWLRDIADAGKHRGLGRLPEVQGAQPQVIGSLLPLGIPAGGILKFFLVLNDGSKQDVDAVLRAAIEYWRADLQGNNLPSPFA